MTQPDQPRGAADPAFADHYRQHLAAPLAALEARRKRVGRRISWGAPIGAAVGGVALLVVARAAPALALGGPLVAAALAVAALLGALVAWAVLRDGISSEFRHRVIGPVASFIEPGLRYQKDAGVGQALFEASQIFAGGVDRYHSSDLVSGTVGGIPLELAEVNAEHRTTDSKGRASYNVIFRGLFVVAHFAGRFAGRTLVVPDFAPHWRGRFGRSLQALGIGRPGSLVKLDDPEFERAFAVYSDDPGEARTILSPGVRRRILAFAPKTNSAVSLSFHDSRLFLAIALDRDLFEPPVFRSLLDPALVDEYLRDLQRAVGIVEAVGT